MRHALRAQLAAAEARLGQLQTDLSNHTEAERRLARRIARLARRRWLDRLLPGREGRAHTRRRLEIDRQTHCDDLLRSRRRITETKIEIETLALALDAAEASRESLVRYLATTADCLQHTELGELQILLRDGAQKRELQRELTEAVDEAGQLRRRINATTKHLQAHLKYHRRRKKGQRREEVATMDEGPAARFQELLVAVHSAHGRFEAELRDVYRAQWRCATRADRQVEEVLGAYRRHLFHKNTPNDLRHRRVDRELKALKHTVIALARELRREQRATDEELLRLDEAKWEALCRVA